MSAQNAPKNGGGQDAPKTWGAYTPNFGFKVANTEFGDMNISIYTYVRYLNQKNRRQLIRTTSE